MVSLAITASASNLQSQISNLQFFRWISATQKWQPVAASETLTAGTVLWLNISTNATLSVIGTYTEPTPQSVASGPNFLPSAGLEAWDLKSAISNLQSVALWSFDSLDQSWFAPWSPDLPQYSTQLPTISPCEVFCLRASASAQCDMPDSALRIRYYHQDHLGSSSVITDAAGQLVEEDANYAFGYPRQQFQPRGINESFQFTQKERDCETTLDYYERRYLSPNQSMSRI